MSAHKISTPPSRISHLLALCCFLLPVQVLAAAQARRDVLVQVGLEYRYMPPVARLLAEVKKGSVGRVHMVAIREHRFPFLVKVLSPLRMPMVDIDFEDGISGGIYHLQYLLPPPSLF